MTTQQEQTHNWAGDLLAIARAIAAHMPPTIPVDVALWSTADCAAYLRISESSFQQRVACLPVRMQ